MVFVTEGRDAKTVSEFSHFLSEHTAAPEQIASVSMDMSPAFIKGVTEHLPNARITFDKFHVVAHASAALDKVRRLGAENRSQSQGLRWVLLKDRQRLSESQRADLDAFTVQITTGKTVNAQSGQGQRARHGVLLSGREFRPVKKMPQNFSEIKFLRSSGFSELTCPVSSDHA